MHDGRKPLAETVPSVHLDDVKYLNSLPQTNLDSQDYVGSTFLMYAVYENNFETV